MLRASTVDGTFETSSGIYGQSLEGRSRPRQSGKGAGAPVRVARHARTAPRARAFVCAVGAKSLCIALHFCGVVMKKIDRVLIFAIPLILTLVLKGLFFYGRGTSTSAAHSCNKCAPLLHEIRDQKYTKNGLV
jgi:hypothetical protein